MIYKLFSPQGQGFQILSFLWGHIVLIMLGLPQPHTHTQTERERERDYWGWFWDCSLL